MRLILYLVDQTFPFHPLQSYDHNLIDAKIHVMLKILIQKDYKFLLHVFAMIVAIVFGLVLNINRIEWIFILIAIALVLTVEALNTAIEYVVDLVTVEYHDLAKYAKDIAAFSVLIVSILAFIIGLIVFLPHFIALF